MKLTLPELARMVDLSAIRTDTGPAEIRRMADVARRYNVVCVFPMPCYLAETRALLADAPDVGLGGVVGFPSGAVTTETKVAEARGNLALGATELDMVVNVGLLLGGEYDRVRDDIRAVVDTAAERAPVKVILEVHYLDDDRIRRGAELCVQAGAAFVKTSTGWPPTGATAHNIRLIKSVVGDAARVKASGGIRDLDTLVELYRCGARRFGVSAASGEKILDTCAALPGGAVDV